MPYQVYKGDGRGDGSGLMQKIVEQVQNGRLKEISDLRDESDKSGIRLVIELKRDAIPKVVLNKLYKHTRCRRRSASTWLRSSTACRGRSACCRSSATTSITSAT